MNKPEGYGMLPVLMKKQKSDKITSVKFGQLGLTFILGASLILSIFSAPMAMADQFDQQIAELRAENSETRGEISQLELQADDLKTTIAKLQQRINDIEAKIVENQAKRVELKQQIVKAENELALQKDLLGESIRAMYLEGDISTLEMLAASKDLSEFLDKQEYRSAIQDNIKITLDKINALKAKLTSQKQSVEALIAEQTELHAQVAADKTEQSRLLNLNAAQRHEFNNQIIENKEKIEELRQQQIIANLALFGGGVQPGIPGGGGYPWGNAYCVHTGQVGGPCFNYDWYFNGGAWDSWGYGFRNCTSWVGYKLAMDGKAGIGNLGNAAQWPGNASARGFKVTYGSGAKTGTAAVNPNGYYGHVMYVEAVLPDGRVVVSDYNRAGDGYYRGPDSGNAGVLSQAGLVFIHF